ncbi:MAG: DinB family protein [Acidobacteriota bacterium]|nr:DinB family protein [Acidobacteriota bacterium]
MMDASRLRTTRRDTDTLLTQLSSLAEMAKERSALDVRAPSVSDWSVGEQLEHLRRSDATILDALTSLDIDGPRQGSPTLAGRLVLFTRYIPRGIGRAPGATQPLEVDLDSLPRGLADVRQGFAALASDLERLALCRATIRHPALGHFTAAQMLAFTGIHHHHHHKIINDIRRSNEQGL